jgi:hypothetical protein
MVASGGGASGDFTVRTPHEHRSFTVKTPYFTVFLP